MVRNLNPGKYLLYRVAVGCFLILPQVVQAQLTNLQCQWATAANGFVVSDSSIILSATLQIPEHISYRYDPVANQIRIEPKSEMDSLEICYRVLTGRPTSSLSSSFHYDSSRYSRAYYQRTDNSRPDTTAEKITKTGILSRSLNTANSGGFGVNSYLDLRIDGELSDNLNISGYLSDQNMPYSAEGNYHNIREYDEIGLTIYNEDFSLSTGDLLIGRSDANYHNFQKQMLGIGVQASRAGHQAAVYQGISRGKFHSYQLQVIPGVRGPYRLTGGDGATIITIVPGTERVTLDGKPLQPGHQHDYLIDYNTAEITFNPGITLLNTSRVYVEFDYTNQAYQRNLTVSEYRYEGDKVNVSLQYKREKDNPFKPLFTEMSSELYQYLSSGNAKLLMATYQKKDTLVNDTLFSVFEYTEAEDGIPVGFLFAGSQGSYQEVNQNGVIFYQWVGGGKGQFQPQTNLSLPQESHSLEASLSFQITPNEQVNVTTGWSVWDQNAVNPTKSQREEGLAVRTQVTSSGRKLSFLPKFRVLSSLSHEVITADFRPESQNSRAQENYQRTGSAALPGGTQLLSGDLALKNDGSAAYHIDFSAFQNSEGNLGSGWGYKANQNMGRWEYLGSLETFQMGEFRFWRDYQQEVAYNFSGKRTGIRTQGLKDDRLLGEVQSRVLNQYVQHQVFFEWADSLDTDRLALSFREDQVLNTEGLYGPRGIQMLEFDFKQRWKYVEASSHTRLSQKLYGLDSAGFNDIFQSNTTIKGNLFNTIFSYHLGAEFSKGREIQREYVFLPVPFGQGTHTWRDDDQDGEKDLDEFYEAINPEDRIFAKFFHPTQNYLVAFQGAARQSHQVQMHKSKNANDWLKGLVWHHQLSWQGKSEEIASLTTSDLGGNHRWINRLEYRFPIVSTRFHFLQRDLSNAQLTVNGLEGSRQTDFELGLVQPVGGWIDLRVSGRMKSRENFSQFLPDRNYAWNEESTQIGLDYLFRSSLRFSVEYEWTDRAALQQEQPLKSRQVSILANGSITPTWNIQASLRQAAIRYQGVVLSPLGFEMLQGLSPGKNVVWDIRSEKRINESFSFSVQYYGRTATDASAVHFGQVQVNYLF